MTGNDEATIERLHRELEALRAENARLRRESQDVASANVHAAMQMVEVHLDRERTLAAKNREIEAALARAEDASRQKSRFLANMSHELRTPLAGIRGLAELAMQEPLSASQSDHVAAIVRTADSFLELVNQLLDITKIEAGKLELEQAQVDLWLVLEEAVHMLQVAADAKQLDVQFTLDPALPRTVLGDPLRLQQILQNLCSNAVKFTSRGHVTVHADEQWLNGARSLRVDVIDSGCGISAADQTRLFEPFVQADTSTTRRFGGTGLGLAISRQLARKMGGEITLSSTPGQGTSFSFVMPLRPLPATDAERSRLRVGLCAEPAPSSDHVAAHLQAAGHQVLRVTSAAALRDIATDAVVVCCATDGGDELAALDALGEAAPQRVLLLVHGGATTDAGRANLAGRQTQLASLTKPWRPTRFLALLDRLAGPRTPDARPLVVGAASGMRVLLAEDTEVSRRVAEAQLRRLGCEVVTVGNGRDAVDAMRTGRFDLALLDCHMPELDGYGAARAIRALAAEEARNTPIVALTADALATNRDACLEAGMNDVWLKPLSLQQLSAGLQRWHIKLLA